MSTEPTLRRQERREWLEREAGRGPLLPSQLLLVKLDQFE
jgi:hypothetical protein